MKLIKVISYIFAIGIIFIFIISLMMLYNAIFFSKYPTGSNFYGFEINTQNHITLGFFVSIFSSFLNAYIAKLYLQKSRNFSTMAYISIINGIFLCIFSLFYYSSIELLDKVLVQIIFLIFLAYIIYKKYL